MQKVTIFTLSVLALIFSAQSESANAQVGRSWWKKLTIPTMSASEQAREVARGVYGDRIKAAGENDAKTRLAVEMLRDAQDNATDPPRYYVVLQLARKLATASQDIALAMEVIQTLDDAFEIDASAMRIEALDEVASADTGAKQHRVIAAYYYSFAEKAMAKGDRDSFNRLMTQALDVARRGRNPSLVRLLENRIAEIDLAVKSTEEPAASGQILNDDSPFAGRSPENRRVLELWYGNSGSTKETEQAVRAALYWLAHHQSPDGSWSLRDYSEQCKDKTCTGPGGLESISGATGSALLPFLTAGQSDVSIGPFQQNIRTGVNWLVNHQKPDGDLSAGAEQQMFAHGLATMALCEDYGMGKDKKIGAAAQRAIDFIQAAQNKKTGSWPSRRWEDGGTSVVGWELTALKSAQMAGLSVNSAVWDATKHWLASVGKGGGPQADTGLDDGSQSSAVGQFSYRPEGNPTPSMTAVGLLCSQYLHADRHDPVITGGAQYLMTNLPDDEARNVYYLYYATQVLHNMADKNWETWNRKMRKILVTTQARQGCAAGSWDPNKPTRDAWGPQGGRIMMTSLSALTLEVYYRYPPVYESSSNSPATEQKK